MKILIVGASMAGLSATIALRRRGHAVELYERSRRDYQRSGGGIVAQKEMVRFLERYELAEPGELAVPAGDRVFLDIEGEVLERRPDKNAYTAWDTVYRRLRRKLPPGTLVSGKELVEVEESTAAVTLHFSDGTVASGDLLIGADGILSPTRRSVYPAATPEYAGYVAWRGVVPLATVKSRLDPILTSNFVVYSGEGTQILAYPIPEAAGCNKPEQRRINFVWYESMDRDAAFARALTDRNGEAHSVAVPRGLIHPDIRSHIREHARTLLPTALAQLVCESEEPFVQGIFDLEMPRLIFGRVILLGDSGILIRPHIGYGASKAMSEADSLAEALGPANAPADLILEGDALVRWEATTIRRGHELAARGKTISRQHSLAC